MRPVPNQTVLENLIRYENEIAIAAPVWHELRFSWLRMPHGQRKDVIWHHAQDLISFFSLHTTLLQHVSTRNYAPAVSRKE